MPNTNQKKDCQMATSPLKHRSAIDDVLDDFDDIVDRAAETMTDEEFREAEKKSKELARRSAVSPSRHRETA
jgi:hypothetical protein